MSGVRRAGFYTSADELRRDVRPVADPDEETVVAYLEAAGVALATPSRPDDLLDPTALRVCQGALFTDGEWFWPAVLAYYVRRYHVRLPDELLARIRSFGGRPPELDEAELMAATERFVADPG
ncbi:hypothetical protein [Kitasatospora purpeofusca]|uniref:SUKH-4 immunity protein of toxin-antitoxin system n=1 Tax=Kitasatospora purpeofusca TaxID=67352 RepID=A0ABZ1TTS5_9ACTN|nr:hypothetical protein [Kitasatospora purpeofusca]